MNDLVTVVVPIYNAEKYLDRCVLSIINQTYRNLEILLVDDGSPDNCPQICDDYAQKDSRIKVIHKENAGAGFARNTGIDYATGKYICFFDSDDYVELDAIEKCVAVAKKNAADMVLFGHDIIRANETASKKQIPCPPKQLYTGKEVANVLLPMSLYNNLKTGEDWKVLLSPWNKLYSMDVIRKNKWRFVSERKLFSEDHYSLTELYGYLHRVYIMDCVLYHYTVNGTSLSNLYKPNHFEKIKVFNNAMISLSQEMEIENILEQPIKGATFGFTIGAMKHIVSSKLRFCERRRELKKIVTDDCLQEIVRTTCYSGCNLQKKLLYWAVKHKQVWLCFLFVYLKNKRDRL